jgi:hypothetical protein
MLGLVKNIATQKLRLCTITWSDHKLEVHEDLVYYGSSQLQDMLSFLGDIEESRSSSQSAASRA